MRKNKGKKEKHRI